jgi:hypothetical protein
MAGLFVRYSSHMAVEPQQLLTEADAIRDEAKSLERRIRLVKQMAAKHADNLEEYLQSKEDTSGSKQGAVEGS